MEDVKVKKPKTTKQAVESKDSIKAIKNNITKKSVKSKDSNKPLDLFGAEIEIKSAKENRVRVNLSLPESVHRKLRVYDIEHGDRGLVPTIEDMIVDFLKEF